MLVERLRLRLTVSFAPLVDVVARLDTTTSTWVLVLDSLSSDEDQCWAMLDVLTILHLGPEAAEHAVDASRAPECEGPGSRTVLGRHLHCVRDLA